MSIENDIPGLGEHELDRELDELEGSNEEKIKRHIGILVTATIALHEMTEIFNDLDYEKVKVLADIDIHRDVKKGERISVETTSIVLKDMWAYLMGAGQLLVERGYVNDLRDEMRRQRGEE